MKDTEHITRGDLPHWYKPGHAHFITYQLADSIPRKLLLRWRDDRARWLERPDTLALEPAQYRERVNKHFYRLYDDYLDRHASVKWLQDEAIAAIVKENLNYHNGKLYQLLAWCIMPNHVHLLIQPFESALNCSGTSVRPECKDEHCCATISEEVSDRGSVLSTIMHSLKSYTANNANKTLGRTGRFWQSESYDHWVRDLHELERVVQYIKRNPVSAGLCNHPVEWKFSSSSERYALDGSDCGLVGWLRDDWRR